VLERHGLDADELGDVLDHRSGLFGVSGQSSDVRVLLAAQADGDPRAQLALELFVRRAAHGIAAATTSLERLDALVFTGGIGENAAVIRARIVARLAPLGIRAIPDTASDADERFDDGGGPAVLRIESREDVVIAEATAAIAG
jgi:acetate kinase